MKRAGHRKTNAGVMIPIYVRDLHSQIHKIKRVGWWLPGAAGRRNMYLLIDRHKVSAKQDE